MIQSRFECLFLLTLLTRLTARLKSSAEFFHFLVARARILDVSAKVAY